jgi:proline iminopeptidase
VPAASPALSSPPATLYPDTAAFAVHALPVGEGHVLHVAEHGRPDGVPAVVLHGGPGSGTSPLLRRVFDPQRYRVVCIDQRGAGLSRPRGAVRHNDTTRLLADLRSVRTALGITRWLVVGGSWGATLALLHAGDTPEAVTGLLLRASFLARPQEIADFLAPLGSPVALAQAFASGPLATRSAIARAWWAHEQALVGNTPAAPLDDEALARQVDRYRVQSHYLAHGCWLGERTLVARCATLPAVPTLLLHGRADRVCPPDGAQALQRALPHAALHWIDGAGHDPAHPAMVDATVRALDHFAASGRFEDGTP